MKWLLVLAALIAVGATAWAQSKAKGKPNVSPPVTLPDNWRVLSELVLEPAEQADGAAVRLEQRRGYGDPAGGCYAVEQTVSVPNQQLDRDSVVKELTQALAGTGIQLGTGDPVPLSAGGVSGAIYTHVSTVPGDRLLLSTLSCFHNQRQPDICEARCRQLAGSLERIR